MDHKGEAFLQLLKSNRKDIRYAIDLFVYQHGYHEFLKVKNELERSDDYMDIRERLEKALWTEVEHLSRMQTKQGVFNILHARFDGEFIDIPSIYIDTFPADAKLFFVVPTT